LHRGITHAAYFTAAVQLLFVVNLVWSAWRGPVAVQNPWGASDREWLDKSAS